MALGMGSSVVDVGVAITLQDRFSTEAGKVSQSFRNLMNEANIYQRSVNEGAGVMMGVSANILQGLGQAFQYSARVTGEVWRAGQVAGASAEEQTQLLQKAFDVNRLTPISAMEAASAERYLAMAGNNAKQVQDMLQPAAELGSILGAQIGGKGGVADMMTNIMATYGIESSKAASVTDDLYTAVTSANMSLDDLAQSITYAGSYANVAGISLRETAAAIGVMGNQGIQGTRAGVALGNMFNYLMQSISGYRDKGYQALQSWGITPDMLLNSEGKLKSLKNTMNVLASVMRKMTGDQQIAFLADVMQVRATRATVAMYTDMFRTISQGGQTFDKIMERYDQNQGVVHQKTLEYLNTSAGALDELSSTWENLIVVVGHAFAPWVPIIRTISNVLQGLVNLFQGGKNPVTTYVVQWFALLAAVNLIRGAFQVVRTTLVAIKGLSQMVTNQNVATNNAVKSTISSYQVLEGHLITILRMMGQMVYLQMRLNGLTPVLGKNGRVTLRDSKGVIRGNWGTKMGDVLAGTMMAGAAGAAASNATRAAGTAAAGAATGAVARGTFATIGSRLLGFLGGPWTLAITTILPLILQGVNALVDSSSETAKNTANDYYIRNGYSDMASFYTTNDPYRTAINGRIYGYGKAMANALNPNYEVNLLINGRKYGPIPPGVSNVEYDDGVGGLLD